MAAGPFGNPNRGARAPNGTLGQWERAISMHRSAFSHICQVMPNGRGIMWFGIDAPHGTAYLPFFANSAGPAPESYRITSGGDKIMSKFSRKVAWWAFNMVTQYMDLNFKLIQPDVHRHALKVEEEGRALVAQCSADADSAEAAHGAQAARQVLHACGNKFVEEKVAEWWEMGFSLFAKYGRYSISVNDSVSGQQLWEYPEWWVKSPDVGYTLWSPHGPFHGIPAEIGLVGFASHVSNQWMVIVLAVALLSFGYKAGSSVERKRAMARENFGYLPAP